ncbi:MAG TPA: FtsW/RodA/SpoVE family cell cycle protein, partial [Marmoricola sp.]|nr:FtsW/RodA/SpoVE family cell cycle protein [Marmoricola sp.]
WFGTAILIAGTAGIGIAASSAERRERLTTFVNPFNDFRGQGWQAGNGLLGMSNGGLFGRGLSASQQKWGNLPEAHTDFIFAVIGEEWGLVGTLLVLILFAALLWACVQLALTTQEPFVRYATSGVAVWLIVQMMINVGMVLALLPVIGLPLPLVSYGGSALVPTLVALGMVIGFARNEPDAKAALSDKRLSKRQASSVGASVGALTRWRGRFGR